MTVRVYIIAADTPHPLEFQLKPSRDCPAGTVVQSIFQTVSISGLTDPEVMRPLARQILLEFKARTNVPSD